MRSLPCMGDNMDLEKLCEKNKGAYYGKIDYKFYRRMWENILFRFLMSMFVYHGLPDSIPQREIEFKLLISGKGTIIRKKGKLYAANGAFSGVTEYYDINPNVTWSLLNGAGVRRDYDFVRCKNNTTETSSAPLVQYYGDLLAHASISLRCALVNTRAQKIVSAHTQQQKNTLDKWFNDFFRGDVKAILDTEQLSRYMTDGASIPVIDIGAVSTNDIMNCWLIIQNLLHNFFDMIGIRSHTDKKERLVTDEVTSDTPMLMLAVDDMLQCRITMCEEVNQKYGESWDVELNPKIYGFLESEVNDNGYDGESNSDGNESGI